MRVTEGKAEALLIAVGVLDERVAPESDGKEVEDPVKLPPTPLMDEQLEEVGVTEEETDPLPPLRVAMELREAAGKAEVPRVRVEILVEEGEEEGVFVGGEDLVEVGLAVEDLEVKALPEAVSTEASERETQGVEEEEMEGAELPTVPTPVTLCVPDATPLPAGLSEAALDRLASQLAPAVGVSNREEGEVMRDTVGVGSAVCVAVRVAFMSNEVVGIESRVPVGREERVGTVEGDWEGVEDTVEV